MSDLATLESRIDYRFQDRELLIQALTHRSFNRNHNERFEFLGDSILGFVVANILFDRFPHLPEGSLTRMRAGLVRRNTLAEISRQLTLGEFLYLGEGELKSGGYDRDSILSNTLEALFGAVYLDGGFTQVERVIRKLFECHLSTIMSVDSKDNKTQLQEAMQKNEKSLPVYEVIDQQGKPHQLIFKVRCSVEHPDSPFLASGSSRRIAEQKAAGLALRAIRSLES